MKLNGAQIVWESLLREGVEVIFGIRAARSSTCYHALAEYPIHHVLVRHEQAAAHAADGYARATGKVGVCIATSGPGATNLVTGIATAYMDSSPMVAITGQVPTPLIGTRQLPGSGHHRHHPAHHQAQLSGRRRRRSCRDDQRGLPHRPHRPARPGADRHARTTSRPPRPSSSTPRASTCPATAPRSRATTARSAGGAIAEQRRARRSSSPGAASTSRARTKSCWRWRKRRRSP